MGYLYTSWKVPRNKFFGLDVRVSHYTIHIFFSTSDYFVDSKEKNFHSNYLPCSQYLTTQILNKYQFVPYKKIQYFSQGAEKNRIENHTKLAGGRKLMLPSWKFFSLNSWIFEISAVWNLEILKSWKHGENNWNHRLKENLRKIQTVWIFNSSSRGGSSIPVSKFPPAGLPEFHPTG